MGFGGWLEMADMMTVLLLNRACAVPFAKSLVDGMTRKHAMVPLQRFRIHILDINLPRPT